MIIKTFNNGQLGNKLYDFSSFIAYSLAHNKTLVYLDFAEYHHYFEFSESSILSEKSIYVNKNKALLRWFRFGHKLLNSIFNKKNPFVYSKIAQTDNTNLEYEKITNKLQIFGGGWYVNWQKFQENSWFIKKCFRLKSEYINGVNKVISDARKQTDILVGVHIRRGDYKEFKGGAYFYSNDVYKEKMREVSSIFSKKGKVGFMICSNEEIDYPFFEEYNLVKSIGKTVEDLYSLAACDYIIGPPSTFSMWASFYGDVPLGQIYNSDQIMISEDFLVFDVY